ncbi:MAG: hypothetical protein R3B13_16945 [Polyangiaceae bacterium]
MPRSSQSSFALDHLTDEELLSSTRSMVGRSNVMFAALLAHLAEVDARRLYRERACSSLYTYCVYELRMSEDAAQRRVQAARLVRKFPELLEVVAAGELHLTGLLLLGPHLTHENLARVLLLAKHRSKREILALVRRLDPQPNAPARIEPLGPAVVTAVCGGTWEKWVGSLVPVNHLKPGERPRDWIPSDADVDEMGSGGVHTGARGVGEHGYVDRGSDERGGDDHESDERGDGDGELGGGDGDGELGGEGGDGEPGSSSEHGGEGGCSELGDSRRSDGERSHGEHGVVPLRGEGDAGGANEAALRPRAEPTTDLLMAPQRYKVQFTASEEHIQLLREARELLGTAVKGRAIEEVHLRAMRAFVRELKKRKCAMVDRPRSAAKTKAPRQQQFEGGGACRDGSVNPRQSGAKHGDTGECSDESMRDGSADPRRRGSKRGKTSEGVGAGEEPEASRAIPAWVRRAVWERDGGRCSYHDSRGQRCRERSRLEFHHELAFAKRGQHTVENVWLRCKAHNDLAAEEDFGEAHMARVKGEVPP